MIDKEKIDDQRLCFAIKACHMMGKDVEETSYLLCADKNVVRMIFGFIEKDMIDFDSI